MRPTRDEWCLALARVVATRSTCLRRSVGCVLVDAKGRVLSTGYNGVAAGMPHCDESTLVESVPLAGVTEIREVFPNACAGAFSASGTDLDACEAIHAEANALLQCRDVDAVETVYCTTAPCVGCAKLLLATGARRIVFAEGYPTSGRALWERAGREWVDGSGL